VAMATHNKAPGRMRGFTLVELVVTLVVAAILSVGVLSYINDSLRGLVLARTQNQLASEARALLGRLTVELYNAVPNSLRIAPTGNGNQCLEFIPFSHVSTYVEAPFSEADDHIDVIATDASNPLPSGMQVGLHAVLYPIEANPLYDLDANGPVALVDEVDAVPGAPELARLQLSTTHSFPRRSPLDRVFLSSTPVSFCIEGKRLYRYAGYGFSPAQCGPADSGCPLMTAGSKGLLAENIDNADLQAFTYTPGTLQRNGLILFDLRLRRGDSTLALQHELLLRNVP